MLLLFSSRPVYAELCSAGDWTAGLLMTGALGCDGGGAQLCSGGGTAQTSRQQRILAG